MCIQIEFLLPLVARSADACQTIVRFILDYCQPPSVRRCPNRPFLDPTCPISESWVACGFTFGTHRFRGAPWRRLTRRPVRVRAVAAESYVQGLRSYPTGHCPSGPDGTTWGVLSLSTPTHMTVVLRLVSMLGVSTVVALHAEVRSAQSMARALYILIVPSGEVGRSIHLWFDVPQLLSARERRQRPLFVA